MLLHCAVTQTNDAVYLQQVSNPCPL